MNRTRFPSKEKEQSVPINLIRSIAWNFYRSSKVNWDELFSEACLAYCESLRKWSPTKGASQTTWAYVAMRNALINFCKKETKNEIPKDVSDWYSPLVVPMYEFFQDDENWTPDTRCIVNMIRENPDRYINSQTTLINQIKIDLREVKKWSWQRIWTGVSNLKLELNVN